MYRIVFVVTALFAFTVQAEARPHTYIHHIQYFRQAMATVPSDERIVGGRPSGCPNAFCGCEASLYKFGHIVPELNLAGNWRRFPRAAPAPGMAAVSAGHVMILQQHVEGNVWYVHDGNSGGHVTREHARSIAGYTIVDPSAGSVGSPSFAGSPSSTFAAPSAGYTRTAQSQSFTRPARVSRFARTTQTASAYSATNTQVPIFAN
jgi:hypothetical protein